MSGGAEISIVFTSICMDLGLIHMDPGLICSCCREHEQCFHLYIDSWSPLHWLQISPPTGSTVLIASMLIVDLSMLTVIGPPPRIHVDLGLIHMNMGPICADCWSCLSWLSIHPQDPCGSGADLHRPGADLCGLLILSMLIVDSPKIHADSGLMHMDLRLIHINCWSSLCWLFIDPPTDLNILIFNIRII